MAKRMPQTEEKAKGLIGLEKGKKVKGAAYSVGNYKGKTLNLSKKQIAASGKRAVSASRQKATNISDTNFVAGKGVMKGGKLFTGTVDLGGGNMATYVGGKRVRARSAGGGGGGGGPARPKNPGAGKKYEENKAAVGNRTPAARRTYEERKAAVGAKTPKKPSNVSQSVWERMSLAQKAATAGAILYPGTPIPLKAAALGALTGNAAGTAVKNRRAGSGSRSGKPGSYQEYLRRTGR